MGRHAAPEQPGRTPERLLVSEEEALSAVRDAEAIAEAARDIDGEIEQQDILRGVALWAQFSSLETDEQREYAFAKLLATFRSMTREALNGSQVEAMEGNALAIEDSLRLASARHTALVPGLQLAARITRQTAEALKAREVPLPVPDIPPVQVADISGRLLHLSDDEESGQPVLIPAELVEPLAQAYARGGTPKLEVVQGEVPVDRPTLDSFTGSREFVASGARKQKRRR